MLESGVSRVVSHVGVVRLMLMGRGVELFKLGRVFGGGGGGLL